jgi:hypothetical protein
VRIALVLLVACSRVEPEPAPEPPAPPSNTTRADYIGPEACGECHAEEYAAWSQSLHRVMNARAADPGAVIGDFATHVAYQGGEVTFARDGAVPTMTLRKDGRAVRYRVTRTIGRRALQEYVGVEDGHEMEVRLPFGFWPRGGGWAPQNAFDPWLDASFDAYAPVHEPWAERCPWCHSTYPFAQRIARPAGIGHGLEQLVAQRGQATTLDVSEQVTTGISCESCHLGGRAHAAGAPIDFLPHAGAAASTFAEQRTDARVVNRVCAQCHSGPSPRLADGTAMRNSSEALDLPASPCTNIRCTDCHDPHRADSRADEPRAIAACTHCHPALADAAAAARHAGPGHATTTCLDCHMPRLVMGIDRFVRSHRISSPTDPALAAQHAPTACDLCHLDRHGDEWLASKSATLRVLAAHAYARSGLTASQLARKLAPLLRDPVPYVRAWARLALTSPR